MTKYSPAIDNNIIKAQTIQLYLAENLSEVLKQELKINNINIQQ